MRLVSIAIKICFHFSVRAEIFLCLFVDLNRVMDRLGLDMYILTFFTHESQFSITEIVLSFKVTLFLLNPSSSSIL